MRNTIVKTDLDALKLCIKYGVTGRADGIGGNGLYKIAKRVEEMRGYFYLQSGNAWLGIREDRLQYAEGLAPVPGLQLWIKLPF